MFFNNFFNKLTTSTKSLIIILGLINFFFFILTFNIPWISDDYPLVYASKLYNLITNNIITFDTGFINQGRFAPLYSFFFQIIPGNFKFFHFIVIFFHFLSGIFFYYIVDDLLENKKIAFMSTILFTINYSITIKSLVWISFYGHAVNCFFGLSFIYFFLNYLKNNSKIILILSLSLGLIGCMIMESGLIYPILLLLILFLFKKKTYKNIFLSITPILVYFCLSIVANNSALELLKERTGSKFSNKTLQIVKSDKNKGLDSKLYWYRSTYAPRDIKGYGFRVFDNIINTLNLSSLEKSLKSLDKENLFKNNIKKNLTFYILFFCFLFLVTILLIFTKIIRREKKFIYAKFIIIYLAILFIYSIIFFRKDFVFALLFPSTVILSLIFYDSIKQKYYILAYTVLFLYSFPTFIYALTKFEYFSNHGSRYEINKLYMKYNNSLNKKNNELLLLGNDFKYYYYYHNYEKEKSYLNQFQKLKYKSFTKSFLNKS